MTASDSLTNFSPDLRSVILQMLLNHEHSMTIHRYTGVPVDQIDIIRKAHLPKAPRKDSLFKTIFQNKAMFMMFIQDFIDQDWVKSITPDHLELHPSLFPEIMETDRESDIVYKVKNENNERFVFILLENQTTVDQLMPFRILEYMTRLWRRHIQTTSQSDNKPFKLPSIVPILFYDGDGSWTAETHLSDKVQDKSFFQRYIPEFEYILIDLSSISFEELEALKNPQSLALILDKIRTPEDLKTLKSLKDDYWHKVKTIIDQYNLWDLIEQLIYIFMKAKHAEKTHIEETLEKIREREVKKGMIIYSEALDVKKAKDKGILEGEELGIKKIVINMLKKGMDEKTISASTDLPLKKIRKIKSEMKDSPSP